MNLKNKLRRKIKAIETSPVLEPVENVDNPKMIRKTILKIKKILNFDHIILNKRREKPGKMIAEILFGSL
jgi:2,3-bisphosphoglycerate-independent phosphoglycerate mutase